MGLDRDLVAALHVDFFGRGLAHETPHEDEHAEQKHNHLHLVPRRARIEGS